MESYAPVFDQAVAKNAKSFIVVMVLPLALLLACAVYLYLSAGTVYQTAGWMRTIKALILVLAAAGIFLGYRFLLLLFTLYTT